MDGIEVVKIIGIKQTQNAKNADVTNYNYYYTKPYTQYEMDNSISIQGVACDSEFTMTDIGCEVGDEVELFYRKGYMDKAQLVGCNIVKKGKPAASASAEGFRTK